MSKKLIASGILTVFVALLNASDANAWFRFSNQTSKPVFVAFQWYSPNDCAELGNWESAGWWKLLPGETKTVFGDDLQRVNKYYYFHAESSDGTLVWAGPYWTCTPAFVFDWCHDLCDTNPLTRILGYREKDIGNYNNYTINLVN